MKYKARKNLKPTKIWKGMGILSDHKQEIWMRTGTSSRSPRQGNCQGIVNKTVALLRILNASGIALQATLLFLTQGICSSCLLTFPLYNGNFDRCAY